jgi:hypothetical protein
MTITVKKNGTAVSSAIKWMSMTPWTSVPKITEHEIDGASYDILYHRGRKSRSCTLTGYCQRTSANTAILEGLKDGSTITVVSTTDGTVSGMCTSLTSTPMKGGLFLTFSMTVVEQ